MNFLFLFFLGVYVCPRGTLCKDNVSQYVKVICYINKDHLSKGVKLLSNKLCCGPGAVPVEPPRSGLSETSQKSFLNILNITKAWIFYCKRNWYFFSVWLLKLVLYNRFKLALGQPVFFSSINSVLWKLFKVVCSSSTCQQSTWMHPECFRKRPNKCFIILWWSCNLGLFDFFRLYSYRVCFVASNKCVQERIEISGKGGGRLAIKLCAGTKYENFMAIGGQIWDICSFFLFHSLLWFPLARRILENLYPCFGFNKNLVWPFLQDWNIFGWHQEVRGTGHLRPRPPRQRPWLERCTGNI